MIQTQSYIAEHKERFLEQLLDLLRIPSVSADSRHDGDMVKAAASMEKRSSILICQRY